MSITELYKIYLENPVICTDTRSIVKDSIFFALKGENFNGNKYAKKAILDGCKYAIIDDIKYKCNKCIIVTDVKKTLQNLAKIHRQKITVPIIGITGSNGKTTTKELVHSVLKTKYNCYYTKGNLNNQIGLPLSILEINKQHEIVVLEMGANQIGEIKNLCEIAKPNTGIITNIGKAHLSGFGNLNGVIKAKTELYKFINKNDGIVFINSSDKILNENCKSKSKITYGEKKNSNCKIIVKENSPFVSINYEKIDIYSKLVGSFQIDNIAAAICIGNFYNIPLLDIKKGIENYIPKNNRTEIIKTRNNKIILDAYNANPSSMNSMINSFQKLNEYNKLCIIGEMRELGHFSKEEHEKVINKLQKIEIETIYVGKEFCNIINKESYLNTKKLIENLTKYNLKNRTILIKGSRGVALEKIIRFL